MIAMLVVAWVCEVVEPGAPRIEDVLAMWFAELGVLDSALEGQVLWVSELGIHPLKVFVGAWWGKMVVALSRSFLGALVEDSAIQILSCYRMNYLGEEEVACSWVGEAPSSPCWASS